MDLHKLWREMQNQGVPRVWRGKAGEKMIIRKILAIFAIVAVAGCAHLAPLSTPPAPTHAQIERAMAIYRAAHPHCEVPHCTHPEGPDNPLNVHHIIPQEACKSINPWLAADTNNMISLCRYQHIALGHCGDGACRWYCPNIREVLRVREVVENK